MNADNSVRIDIVVKTKGNKFNTGKSKMLIPKANKREQIILKANKERTNSNKLESTIKSTKDKISEVMNTQELKNVEKQTMIQNLTKDLDANPLRAKSDRKIQLRKTSTLKTLTSIKPLYSGNSKARNLKQWKQLNEIPDDKKVFISDYPDIVAVLESRGFVRNNDLNSNFFNIKITVSKWNIDSNLDRNQIVNFFQKSGQITIKSNLADNLKNSLFSCHTDMESFYPKSFNLTVKDDVCSFIEYFKLLKSRSVIQNYITWRKENQGDSPLQDMKMVSIAYKILKNKVDSDSLDPKKIFTVSEEEVRYLIHETAFRAQRFEKIKSQIALSYGDLKSYQIQNCKKSSKADIGDYTHFEIETLEALLDQTKTPQDLINGDQNIWILKPCGLSRGRGIKCTDSLNDILIKALGSQYLVQKYIERPLIILNKKFDIRQWVLVSSINPLMIWVYEEPYFRFAVEEYNTNKLTNVYSHLTNNSISKHSSRFLKSGIEGNMWDLETFREYINGVFGSNAWDSVRKSIVNLIINSYIASYGEIVDRKNSFEIYGYDLMLDEKLNPWLIEVNASPAMGHSTSITKRLVRECAEDTMKVVLDHRKDQNADTGKWELVHKGKKVTVNPNLPELLCQGIKVDNLKEL